MSATFAQLAALDGRDLWWGLDVSTDNFATVSYRWATHSGVVDGELYEARILDPIPDFTRGLGADHLPAAADITIELANWDFAVDWLANYNAFASQGFRSRYRLKVGLTDPGGTDPTQATVVTKLLGYFVPFDYPTREEGVVTLSLTDDQLGQLNDLLTPPTTNDWIANGDATDCPFVGTQPSPQVDFNMPWPLRFGYLVFDNPNPIYYFRNDTWGADWQGDYVDQSGKTYGKFPVILCATQNTDALSNDWGIKQVWLNFRPADEMSSGAEWAERVVAVPKTFGAGSNAATIWEVKKSAAINKDGVDWYLIWLAVDVGALYFWFTGTLDVTTQGNGQNTVPGGNHPGGPQGENWPDGFWAAIKSWKTIGTGPWSSITGKAATAQNPVDVIEDLVAFYSPMKDSPPIVGPIDNSRFGRARTARQSFGGVSGEIGVPFAAANSSFTVEAGQQVAQNLAYQGGVLRQALTAICGSADIDLFITLFGQAAVSVQVADFAAATTTYPSVDEERIDNITERVPTAGERWAPYNVVFVTQPDGNNYGPYRNETALAAWGVEKPLNLEGLWWPYLTTDIVGLNRDYVTTEGLVFQVRGLESNVRPVVTFDTDLSFLSLNIDLGDDFLFSWTRGGNSVVYSSSLFRCEQMVFHPSQGTVTITAVYMDDLRTVKAYLLDDETLLTRIAAAGGRTASVADSSTTVTFSSGSLITNGVAAGDHLILKDTTEATTTFKRNRALKIASITDATHLVVSSSDLDFGGSHAVAAWEIRRSYLTYPTSSSDATHYPAGGAMYGKVSDFSGKYSDGTDANELLDG